MGEDSGGGGGGGGGDAGGIIGPELMGSFAPPELPQLETTIRQARRRHCLTRVLNVMIFPKVGSAWRIRKQRTEKNHWRFCYVNYDIKF
jgi:hypothetical protein